MIFRAGQNKFSAIDMDMDSTFSLIVLFSNDRRLIITTWPFVKFDDQSYDYREDAILKPIANDTIGTKKLLILLKIYRVEMSRKSGTVSVANITNFTKS